MIKLLVPVDFSDYSLNALKYAIKLGEKLPSEITLAHCFPEIVDESDLGLPAGTEVKDPKKLIREERDKEKNWLEDLKRKTEQELTTEQKQNIKIKTRYDSLHKLISLISPFKTIIYGIQFNTVKPDKWDKEKLNEFRNYCAGTYRNHKIEADILYSDNFLEDLDKFIKEKGIDIIAMTRKKRNLISSLFHPSITRKILFHTNIPLLVFHA